MIRRSFVRTIQFVFFSAGVASQYENCTGDLRFINDGRCDINNNIVECGYDGGDCCECSCANSRPYPCGISGFSCSDPEEIGNDGVCRFNASSSIRPCSTATLQEWVVNDTASATSLAEAVNCSGGTFNVTWQKNVLIDETISIPDGTTVYLTGSGSEATVDGGSKTRLFTAVGAVLHIDNISLVNGNASYGAAIAAALSNVTLNQTLCSGNMASGYGGALYIGRSSTLTGLAEMTLADNHAGLYGGAVAVSVSSTASWSGATQFFGNLALDGGALFVSYRSGVSWGGMASFRNNTASDKGGAVSVYGNSSLSWAGETSFVDNTASFYGGAVSGYEDCSVLWAGETSFVNNTAGDLGGAVYAHGSSSVSWAGETTFVDNTASLYGGAVSGQEDCSVSWAGETSFVDNTAGELGGAVYASANSSVSWAGETTFVDNTASFYGGAVSGYEDCSVSWAGETSFVDNTAGEFGGAVFAYGNSSLSWAGETSFVNNTAGMAGGAVSGYEGCSISWVENTSFGDNTAGELGGAVYAYGNSSISWAGETSFVNNTASFYGGAVSGYEDCSVSWAGETTFVDNTAGELGGAVHASGNSSLSWAGETSFVDNTASLYGGAVSGYEGCSVSWAGETTFVNNMAGELGGAVFAYGNSSLSWAGETSFVDNTASLYGGAVSGYEGCSVSWAGGTSFVDNTAGEAGGAVDASDNSSVSWAGETTFVNNTAGDAGGAILSNGDCSVSWAGETTFVNNTAGDAGGAVSGYEDCSFSWAGETTFVNNTAGRAGGAVAVYEGSTVSWAGETSFVDNTAGEAGGAVLAGEDSSVSWAGETSFVENTASFYGGALHINDRSFASWTAQTSFAGNKANSSGGALYAIGGSNVSVGGGTHFLNNAAVSHGGSAYLYVGSSDTLSSYFMVGGGTSVIFGGNTCGGSGGAIALIGTVSTRFSDNMTFVGNSAGTAGGAVYIAGVGVGPTFERTRFISNSAVMGGGLYATASGNSMTGDGYEDKETYPTTIVGCEFIGNKAETTGGALDSTGGRDEIVNTSFVRNTAAVGGASRLVGTASIAGCKFMENSSDEDEGAAVSNTGYISEVSNCSFVDNIFNCQAASFLTYNQTTDASFDTVCKDCGAQCSSCNIEGLEPMCTEELEHSSGTGGNTTIETLSIEQGYWRATNASTDILACYNSDACLGGVTGSEGYCDEGYEGPYCSICSEGYTASLGYVCNKCSDSSAGVVALAVAVGIVGIVALGFLSYMLSGMLEDVDRGIVARVSRYIPLQSVKIAIVVWQILTQFSTVANVVFPSLYQEFLDGLDILNFNLSWVLSAGCIVVIDFHDQLLLATLGPLIAVAILGGTYIVAMRRNRLSEDARRIVRRKHVSTVLLLSFLVYSPVSSTVFETFACDNLDDGKNYLRADYRIDCDSPRHEALEVYAGVMIVLYVVGIPLSYIFLLFSNRASLTKNAIRENDESIKPITGLWEPYRPERFYYEVVECARRVLLTGALVFIYPNTAAQIAVALLIAVSFMVASEALAPYASDWDTWVNRTGHLIVFTSMFLALLLKVDVSDESASSQRVFESVLIAAHACMILTVVAEATAMAGTVKKTVAEESEHRVRRDSSRFSPPIAGEDEETLNEVEGPALFGEEKAGTSKRPR